MPQRKVILVAEDLEDDILLIRRAFASAGVETPLHFVRDGEQVIDYLMARGDYANAGEFPLPDLILLDLKMPRMDGFEVLEWIHQHPAFKALRVIVLTSSEDIFDVHKAYELGASSFLVKPFEFTNYPAMMRTLDVFWLKQNLSPGLDRPSGQKRSSLPDSTKS